MTQTQENLEENITYSDRNLTNSRKDILKKIWNKGFSTMAIGDPHFIEICKEPGKLTPKDSLFGRLGLSKEYRPYDVGNLWLDTFYGADFHTRWVFEVYGKDYLPRIQELAEEFSKEYDIKLHIELLSEKKHLKYTVADSGL